MSLPEGTQPEEAALRVTTDPSTRTVVLEGELDLASTDRFVQALRPLLDHREPVTVDLAGLEFMDSSGLRALIQSARKAGTLVLLNPRGQVGQLLKLCDLERLDGIRIEGLEDE